MNLRSLIPSGNAGTRTNFPASPFGSLQREIDRLFEDFTRGMDVLGQAQVNLVPSMDVVETDKEIIVTAEMPGLERKDVEISVEDDVLTIRGEKRVEREEGDKSEQGAKTAKGEKAEQSKNGGRNYHVSERTYGVFVRVLPLPSGVDPSKIQATMSNGVLKVVIPKPARSQAKKIEVKDAA
jgi:HSP20 family protein